MPLLECSIDDIYRKGQEPQTYLIPIYQRNYAWQEDEIHALIKDVYDSMKKSDKSVYYIGTLVTYNRGDNIYEVIDGQQRLTTIYLILKALRVNNIFNKLTYSARKRSVSTIKHLDNCPNLGEEVDNGIRDGYQYASRALDDIVGNDEREGFKQFFLNNVHIIRYSVPKDVDLNHYFEVMNSRGEQLEKHEIVKSMLSEHLDKTDIATFGKVWEACSETNAYIQQTFSDKKVFGNHLNEFVINDFSQISASDKSEGKETIINLLSKPIEQQYVSTAYEQSDKFQPIIDFPNFLLIVLKVTMMNQKGFIPSDFILDDKELLDEFKDSLDKTADKARFAKQFAFNLLKAKFFLDNYIVHHALDSKETVGDNPWKLQYLYSENNKPYLRNLSEDVDAQKELVHLLSMFEVTFTPKQRKNYLFYCMAYLFKNGMPSVRDYLRFLRQLADKYFYDVYLNQECLNERNQPIPNAFDNVILKSDGLDLDKIGADGVDYKSRFNEIYKQGNKDIPLYVFNYTDYRLWKKYSDELRGNKTKKGSRERSQFFDSLGCSDFELDPFNNFYFSRTRKSLEHFYPQEKAGDGKPLSSEAINCFGNFAMIGADANSSGSNWSPKAKLDHYSDAKADQISVASLKFKIMMQMCQDNYALMLDNKLSREPELEWNDDDMQLHQRKMLDIIIKGNQEQR